MLSAEVGAHCMGVITAVTLIALLAVQETTTRIQLSSEEIAEVSCSPALVSSSDLSRWMELSEYGPFSELITVIICPDHPPDVVCGREPNTLNLRMASLDLEKNRELISKLSKDNCPSELSSVVAYFKKSRSFWLGWKHKIAISRNRGYSGAQGAFRRH